MKAPGAKPIDFAYATRSFIGYLEGTEKAAHTIKNYQCDLRTFEKFLAAGLGSRPVTIHKLNRVDLDHYEDYLKEQGFRTNTRRRKMLTIRRLLRYLAKRNKLTSDLSERLVAPNKIERIPETVDTEQLLQAIQALPADTEFYARNRVLLWVLTETGCLVSEISRMKMENWSQSGSQAFVSFGGKSPRKMEISPELYSAVTSLNPISAWLFLGFNKFGPMGSPITPRGIELLVRSYSERLGFTKLTPRVFRHSVVLRWFKDGKTQKEIQERLGLKTAYAFKKYLPVLSQESETG